MPNDAMEPAAAGSSVRRGSSRGGCNMKFEHWLGELLGQNEFEIRRLIQDPTALHFLIGWSLFESKCFDGFVKIGKLETFAARLVARTIAA